MQPGSRLFPLHSAGGRVTGRILLARFSGQTTPGAPPNSAGMNAFTKNDFLVGTLLSGTGVFLLSRTLPSTNKLVQFAAQLGRRYVLGIYVLHLIFVIAFDLDYGSLSFWLRHTTLAPGLSDSSRSRIEPL